MSSASFYKWRAKFGGMDANMMSEMKAMAEKNRRLMRTYAEMSMQNDLLKEAQKKASRPSQRKEMAEKAVEICFDPRTTQFNQVLPWPD